MLRYISNVSGTKVSSATSLVTSIELKKHISTITIPSLRTVPVFFRIYPVALSKTPILLNPATAIISANSSIRTARFMYPGYELSGGIMNMVINAAANDITSTG